MNRKIITTSLIISLITWVFMYCVDPVKLTKSIQLLVFDWVDPDTILAYSKSVIFNLWAYSSVSALVSIVWGLSSSLFKKDPPPCGTIHP